MQDKEIKVVIGGLLHDVGKLLFRYNDGRNHSKSGYDFLKENGIEDTDILNQILYHHSNMLYGSNIDNSSLAYITYWADNVAAGADRRDNDDAETGYDKEMALGSVFNILNGNSGKMSYQLALLGKDENINYPTEEKPKNSEEMYGKIISTIRDNLKGIEYTKEYVNSLLGILEANTSFVPSSTDKSQIPDISLYDHLKITAAVGSCIYKYLEANSINDYKDALKTNAQKMYSEKTFLIYSMDISGIQDFIYTTATNRVLKTLRARSFYMEVMLEHIIDELLEEVGLSRANLIYSGGGHAYLLLPNTASVKSKLTDFKSRLNKWFIDNFKTALYVAAGYAECSADNLMDKPKGSYKEIFLGVSKEISKEKLHKYSSEEIETLNASKTTQNERECKVCGRTDKLTQQDRCEVCEALQQLGSTILTKDFITITDFKSDDSAVIMPLDKYMLLEDEAELVARIKQQKGYVRSYSKNTMYTGLNVSTKLWVGDYHKGDSFEELVRSATGVPRLGVIRADIDNLGQAFVSGFEGKSDDRNHVSLSRTATFSRQLSLFFKLHINAILRKGEFSLKNGDTGERNALVVYSGGDDLFIIGAWDDIVGFALDLNKSLEKYTQGMLKISAGIGVFPEKYPVSAMARQVGELESYSKSLDGKNSLTLFSDEGRYDWKTLREKVIREKFELINRYFTLTNEKGSSSIYKIVKLIRNREDKINISRYAYLLARMEPDRDASEEAKELFREFSQKMYKWIQDTEESRQLLTAIYLYVYLNRTKEEKKNGVK